MRVVSHVSWGASIAALGLLGCSNGAVVPAAAPMAPPTPASVSVKEPGGDAQDPQRAALERLLAEPWGGRTDKDEQLLAPMPDWEHWKRTRYWGFDHLVGFRYGKEHRALIAARVHEMPAGVPVKSETCMREFVAWARPQIAGFDVKLSPFQVKVVRWREQPLVIQSVDGWVSWGIGSADFSAAWAAYPAYKDACVVYGVAVPWRDQPELAKQVRDRWIDQGFVGLDALTAEKAYRHEPQPDPPVPPSEVAPASAPEPGPAPSPSLESR